MNEPADRSRFEHVVAELAVDVERVAGNRNAMRELARSVIALNDPVGERVPPIVCEFMQFYLGTRYLSDAIGTRSWSDAGDWIAWSLSDDINDGQAREINVGRIIAFLQEATLSTLPITGATISQWLWQFYYYARRRAANAAIARELWDVSNFLIEANARTGLDNDGAILAAMCLGWAVQEAPSDLARPIAERVERFVSDPNVGSRARALLGVSLATKAASYTARAVHEWAAYVLQELDDSLVDHERLQLLVGLLPQAYDACTKDSTLREIERLQAAIPASARSTIEARRALDSVSDILLTLLHVALRKDDVAFAIAALGCWYGVDDSNFLIGTTECIVAMTFSDDGFSLQGNGTNFFEPEDRNAALVDVTAAMDAFAGTSNSVAGSSTDAINVPQRFGVPNPDLAAALEAALLDAYVPARSIDAWERALRPRVGQFFLPPSPHPIQAIQRFRLGRTSPWIASLQSPLTDRPIRHVVLWSGASSMTEEMETTAVQALFEAARIEVTLHTPDNAGIEEFVAAYQDASVDVLWISSHGEYDHWYPSDVTIQIARDGTCARLNDLLDNAPVSGARRLLVLNVCDGGRFEQTGALPRIGLAPALASRDQAIISHLWPVRGLAAAAGGALLAAELARGNTFFGAFETMLGQLHSTSDVLSTLLLQILGEQSELYQRVTASNEDFLNLSNYGSPVFFQ